MTARQGVDKAVDTVGKLTCFFAGPPWYARRELAVTFLGVALVNIIFGFTFNMQQLNTLTVNYSRAVLHQN